MSTSISSMHTRAGRFLYYSSTSAECRSQTMCSAWTASLVSSSSPPHFALPTRSHPSHPTLSRSTCPTVPTHRSSSAPSLPLCTPACPPLLLLLCPSNVTIPETTFTSNTGLRGYMAAFTSRPRTQHSHSYPPTSHHSQATKPCHATKAARHQTTETRPTPHGLAGFGFPISHNLAAGCWLLPSSPPPPPSPHPPCGRLA
jgi:hypothetical protein